MTDSSGQTFVLSTDVVTAALKELRTARIHPNFAGYLCLRKAIGKADPSIGIRPNFQQFFDDFLRPSDGSNEKPFIRPFKENGDPASDIWTNPNVAGSYAPSSIRTGSPFRKVINIEGAGNSAMYSLVGNHPSEVLKNLLYGKPLSVGALAIFLYRDYGFDGKNPTISDLISIFREEFGYVNDSEFNEIFNSSTHNFDAINPVFEVISP